MYLYNCVDRHATKTPDKTAIIWEGDDPKNTKKYILQRIIK